MAIKLRLLFWLWFSIGASMAFATPSNQSTMMQNSAFQPQGIELSGEIDRLQLDQIPSWLLATLDEHWQKLLTTMRVQGTLRRVQWRYTPTAWQLTAHVDNLITQPADNIPGINGLSGKLEITSTGGSLHLDNTALTISLPTYLTQPLSFAQINGSIQLQHLADQWQLTINQLQLVDKKAKLDIAGKIRFPTPKQPPFLALEMTLRELQLSQWQHLLPWLKPWQGTLQFAKIMLDYDVNAIATKISHSSKTLNENKELINPLRIKGYINDFDSHWQDDQHHSSSQLAMQDLSAYFEITPNQGFLRLENAMLTAALPLWYDQPLAFQQWQGEIHWQRQPTSWQIATHQLQFIEDNTTAIQLHLGIDLPYKANQAAQQLTIFFPELPLSRLQRYIPNKKAPQLASWFKKGLLAGSLTNAEIKIRGSPANLFDHPHNFEFNGYLTQVDVNYIDNWPVLKNVDAQIALSGRKLTIILQQGKIFDSNLSSTILSLEDVTEKESIMSIVGNINGQTGDVLRFIHESPLHKSIDLTMFEILGNFALQLHLGIGFASQHHTVMGNMSFIDATVHNKLLNLTLTEVMGKLEFSNDKVAIRDMQGKLNNNPIQLSMFILKNQHAKRTVIQATGYADPLFLSQQVKHFSPQVAERLMLTNHLVGTTQWLLTVDFPNEPTPLDAHINITFEADLLGMSVNLPIPLQKESQERRLFSLKIQLPSHLEKKTIHSFQADAHQNVKTERLPEVAQPKVITVQFRYGEKVKGILQTVDNQLTTGMIVIGTNSLMALPKTGGLIITGHLDYFSLTTWVDYLQINFPNSNSSATSPPLLVELRFNQLEVHEQNFTNLILHAKYANSLWQASITGKEIEGQFTIENSPHHKTKVMLNFYKLSLTLSKSTSAKPTTRSHQEFLDPRQLPMIKIHCEQFQLGDMNFGEVAIEAQSYHDGFEMNLSAHALGLIFQTKAQWRYIAQRHQTVIQAQLRSGKVHLLLQQLGYSPPPLQGGNTRLTFDGYWLGTPDSWQLAKLVGVLGFHIEEGHITKVEPGTMGRFLGLFDLNALPRRFFLDFSDVLQKGFGFSDLTGVFFINQGIARTELLLLQAPAATVELIGETNLLEKRFQQIAIIYPHVSNSLPIAGALTGGIGFGVALLGYQLLRNAEIEKIIQFRYRITGPWEHPVIAPFP
jgi:uncharacterized protein (TIGR02099 family)